MTLALNSVFHSAVKQFGRLVFSAGFAAKTVIAAMLLSPMFVIGTGAAYAQVSDGAARAQAIANQFSSVKTMTGEFVQFGSRGEQSGGKFYIERPGKIRFNYDNSPITVIADGESVVVNNKKLDTWDLYPLTKTPLKLLLSSQIDLGGGRLRQVKVEPDVLTMVLGDKSIFADATIALMFDPTSAELKQWTITDAQKQDTTVMIFNVQEGVRFADNMFKIDYQRIAMKRKRH